MVFPFYFAKTVVKSLVIMIGGMTMNSNQKVTASRHQQRVKIIEKLYNMDINNETTFEPQDDPFVNDAIKGILTYQEKIDQLITDHLVKWSIKRLSTVDRAILRLAVYEMYDTNTPAEIIINEALNLTRTFTDEGDNKAVGFNNSVLDKIKTTLNK